MLIIAPDQVAKYGFFLKIFFDIKICCTFSLESPHQGDSNENTKHTIVNIKIAIRGDGQSPDRRSMGLSKLSKYHPLKNEVRLVILVCNILTLPV